MGTFDLVFIDADKERNPVYFKWAVNHSHPGSVIVVDNVVRDGKVVPHVFIGFQYTFPTMQESK